MISNKICYVVAYKNSGKFVMVGMIKNYMQFCILTSFQKRRNIYTKYLLTEKH